MHLELERDELSRAGFGYGRHKRRFTYVDDIVEDVVRALDRVPGKDPNWSGASPDPATSRVAPHRLYNIGNEQQELLRYIEVLAECLGHNAQMVLLPLQAGDVPDTEADVLRPLGLRRRQVRQPRPAESPAVFCVPGSSTARRYGRTTSRSPGSTGHAYCLPGTRAPGNACSCCRARRTSSPASR